MVTEQQTGLDTWLYKGLSLGGGVPGKGVIFNRQGNTLNSTRGSPWDRDRIYSRDRVPGKGVIFNTQGFTRMGKTKHSLRPKMNPYATLLVVTCL